MMPRSSVQSTLLEQVTREVREEQKGSARRWHSGVDADKIAKPFTLFRKLFSDEPDPDLVRRLMLAGYRKPAHADIFLGCAPGFAGCPGFLVAFLSAATRFLFSC